MPKGGGRRKFGDDVRDAIREALMLGTPVDQLSEMYGPAQGTIRGWAAEWGISVTSTAKAKPDKVYPNGLHPTRTREPVARTLESLTDEARTHLPAAVSNVLERLSNPASLADPKNMEALARTLNHLGAFCPALLTKVKLEEKAETGPPDRAALLKALDQLPAEVLAEAARRRGLMEE